MEHYPVDDGYCSCGTFCDTGTGFKKHLKAIEQDNGRNWGYNQPPEPKGGEHTCKPSCHNPCLLDD